MNFSIFSKNKNKGFTLTELIVVLTIATVLMTSVVIQQNKWNSSLALSTQAYEMALMIRQAQVYALGVKENIAGTGDKFDTGYGVIFGQLVSDSDTHAWEKRYIFFANKNDLNNQDNNKIFDAGDTIIETKNLVRGIIIKKFCGIKGSGQFEERCHPMDPGIGNVSHIYISFFRPNPKAIIIFLNNGYNQSSNVIAPATIYLESSDGKCSYVKIEESGQISTGSANTSECIS